MIIRVPPKQLLPEKLFIKWGYTKCSFLKKVLGLFIRYFLLSIKALTNLKKPILVIPDDNGVLSLFVRELKAGIILNTRKEIIDFIFCAMELFKNNDYNWVPKYELDENASRQYLRENQTKELVTTLKTLLN